MNRVIIAAAVAAQRVISALPGIEKPTTIADRDESIYDSLIADSALRVATRTLFLGGHYHLAVLEAYKLLNNTVKSLSGLTSDGSGLMSTAFSPVTPKLALNDLRSQSQKDEQQGYMQVFAGCMTGIRNPRAHETQWPDDVVSSLELLVFAEHLIKKVRGAVRKRRKTKKA